MKKNRMMRLASVLLVCVLLTTSVISGTFAKYTTTNTASDEARVAYWGFDAAANITFDLFDVKTAGDTGVAADGLLAPGTERTINFEFINAKADGRAPEVAYEVVVSTADFCGKKENPLKQEQNFENEVDTSEFEEISLAEQDLPF